MKVCTGTFQDALGSPLIGAKVWFRLSQDAIASGTAVVAPAIVSGTTDGTGVLSVSLYFNDELSPANTTYDVAVVQAGGGLVWGAEKIFINGASFNLNTAVPTSQGVLFANPVVTNPSAQQTINGFPLVMEGAPLGFSAAGSAVSDLGLSRGSAGVLDVGNGTQSDTSATIKAAKFQGTDTTAFSIGSIASVPRIVFTSGNGGFEFEFVTGSNAIAGAQIASIDAFETTGLAGLAGHGRLWSDSTSHLWKANNNNGTSYNLVGDTTAQTLSSKTLTAPVVNGTPTGTGIPTVTLKKGSAAGNYSSSSLTPVVVDGTNLAFTVTIPTGWKLVVQCSGLISSLTGLATVSVFIADGGTGLQTAQVLAQSAANFTSFSLSYVINGDGASHTIDLRYFTGNAADAVTIANSGTTIIPTMIFTLTPSN